MENSGHDVLHKLPRIAFKTYFLLAYRLDDVKKGPAAYVTT